MIVKVSQQELKWNFKYDISVDDNNFYIAEANRTVLPTKRKIIIKSQTGNIILELTEKNMLKKSLLGLPLIGVIASFFCKVFCEYDVFQNDRYIGNIKDIRDYTQPRIEAYIDGSNFTVYQFSLGKKGIKYPVYNDKTQVGLIEKSIVTNFNADMYTAQFDGDSDMICNILMTVFVDIAYHTEDISTQMSVGELKYEWNPLQGFAKVGYDENWRPK